MILEWHTALDKAREERARDKAIGTTGRGIGPTYEDKVARRGVRVADLLQPASLRTKLEDLAEAKNAVPCRRLPMICESKMRGSRLTKCFIHSRR